MLIKVQFQRQWIDVIVEDGTDAQDATVDDLADAIQMQLDVPAHQQKLIVKGKLLMKGDSLAKYGLKDGAKVMLMASGTLTQVLLIQWVLPARCTAHDAAIVRGSAWRK